ncbi:MAG: hypothetical protein DMF10_03390 [Verrucomicrobia bacterium]|nr:MAG: hypothetical protein DMF10_03390 [Verrucomicrobiota bacterium]
MRTVVAGVYPGFRLFPGGKSKFISFLTRYLHFGKSCYVRFRLTIETGVSTWAARETKINNKWPEMRSLACRCREGGSREIREG